jgi:leucyl aminopeptidase
MKIEFAATLPVADVLVIPVPKNGTDAAIGGRMGQEVLAAAAAAARFEGEAGAVAEAFVGADGAVSRILLVGVGDANEPDWERAGGAVTARLLTSAISAAVDVGAVAPAPAAIGRFAGALAQRAWRIDTYRTKLPEKQKPTFAQVTIVGAPDGSEAAWGHSLAITGGLDLTRTLVAEPPNIVYPKPSSSACSPALTGWALRSPCSAPTRWPNSVWGRCSASRKARQGKRGCSRSSGAARVRAIPTSRWSARA